MSKGKIGIVVPTLGLRVQYLQKSLMSIRAAGECHISIISPNTEQIRTRVDKALFDSIILDPGGGLPAAINKAIENFPAEIEYVNWLGDDDLLRPESLSKCSRILNEYPTTILVYGMCEYISPTDQIIWTNRSSKFAHILMRFGPQLVPQPGALFRRSAFVQAGGLSEDLRCAFDLDLFLRLSRHGEMQFTPFVLSAFRWHPDSISVRNRTLSVKEASQVRRNAIPSIVRGLANVWEVPLQLAILKAGALVSRRSLTQLDPA